MFSLFKRMYVWIPAAPQVSDKPTKDTIIATRPEGARGIRKKTIPGQFSTVLVQESERTSNDPLDGVSITDVTWFGMKADKIYRPDCCSCSCNIQAPCSIW
jgi:hypothetical protein